MNARLCDEADLLRHHDQFGDRFCSHLLHHTAAVDLDRLLGSGELHRDLPVELPDDDTPEHLTLPRRESVDPALEFSAFSGFRLALAALGQRARDGVEKLAIITRLLEEVDGASLHGPDGHRNVTEASEEDDRQGPLSLAEVGLEIQPGLSPEPDGEHDASGPGGHLALHER